MHPYFKDDIKLSLSPTWHFYAFAGDEQGARAGVEDYVILRSSPTFADKDLPGATLIQVCSACSEHKAEHFVDLVAATLIQGLSVDRGHEEAHSVDFLQKRSSYFSATFPAQIFTVRMN